MNLLQMVTTDIRISYLIPVHNEHKELTLLLNHLSKFLRENDEIIIQGDQGKVTDEVISVIRPYIRKDSKVKYVEFPLKNDFGAFKNNLLREATGTHSFLIDADELPHPKLLENVHWLCEENPNVDVFWLPRINIVKNITPNLIQKWKWRVENFIVSDQESKDILKLYGVDNISLISTINPFDPQERIIKNNIGIRYQNKVHERLTGYNQFSGLPFKTENDEVTFVWSLFHIKDVDRQIKQNEFYERL